LTTLNPNDDIREFMYKPKLRKKKKKKKKKGEGGGGGGGVLPYMGYIGM